MSPLLWPHGDQASEWSSLGYAGTQRTASMRLWRGFMTARCFIAVVLLILQALTFAIGQPARAPAILLSVGYVVATVAALRYVHGALPIRHFGPVWFATLGVDIATFSALQLMQVSNINYTPLFALPVLMGAVLGTMLIGLGTTATVSILLLSDAALHWSGISSDASPRFMQAALTGTGMFMVSLLAHELARRLEREEAHARRNRNTAQMQAKVNNLVIEALSEGVLVIDAHGQVHASNPAAEAILGYGLGSFELPFVLNSFPAWRPLGALAHQTFMRKAPQSREIPIAQAKGAAREVMVRTRLTPATDARTESLCVMFLQDLRELEARIRTEKLAAMGRMSAAVAHEIRNPLAAISQASALLSEDLEDPAHRKLTAMVEQNAQRLSRIVDDVLDVARARQQRVAHTSDSIDLDTSVRRIAVDWVTQAGRSGVLVALGAADIEVPFDVEHLRRILVNLLDNASRYAGEREGSIQIATHRDVAGRATLQVWSDGLPLEPAVQRHLFEPFFSSESRSSGLGLYLCRELCERHGATIGYDRRALGGQGPEGNEFFIAFASSRAAADTIAA